MSGPNIQQHSQLLINLLGLQTKLHKCLDSSLSYLGISVTEFLVMLHLSNSPNKKMRRIDLAEKIGLTASGVTRLLNPMQKIGLVEKEESVRDARVSLVKLTSAGEKMFEDAERSVNVVSESFLEPLSKSQRDSLWGAIENLR
ncbi:MAG: MarR family winged helix-turn-helix transcriptional regulator [Verrucomicrobiales bacterium]|nr:MarR family winged helix-turn-helix transcriptional regulator [Verrucomicrobiales bacterium]